MSRTDARTKDIALPLLGLLSESEPKNCEEYFCNASRDETKQLSLSPSRARAASQEDSGNGTSCSSGSGNEVTIPGAINELLLISEDFYN